MFALVLQMAREVLQSAKPLAAGLDVDTKIEAAPKLQVLDQLGASADDLAATSLVRAVHRELIQRNIDAVAAGEGSERFGGA